METDRIKNYVEDLFDYIRTYETDYSRFQTEAFLQTYNGIYTVFQPLREQRDQAVELDYYFLDRIRERPLTDSDLRLLTVQILITFFESEADTDGRSNQSYLYCRGSRSVRQDAPFFKSHLLPLLFKEGNLADNFRLNSFFLKEIARYLNRFGKRIEVELSPESFNAMDLPSKLLELQRRRLEMGGDLTRDRQTLEFHLQQVDAFVRLGTKSRLANRYFLDWDYRKERNLWSILRNGFRVLWSKYKGSFSSAKYFRLVMMQRKPAYLLYVIVIAIFLFLAGLVTSWWGDYSATELKHFKANADEVQKHIGG